jgi:hypothetical protein
MKLKLSTIDKLALMICGDTPYTSYFPYRSSSNLTLFFRGIDQKYVHDGSTRKSWVSGVLEELNNGPDTDADLPPEGIRRAIEYLLDSSHFIDRDPLAHSNAVDTVNRVLESEELSVEKDEVKGNVILLKRFDGFISTAKGSKRAKRVVTFSPSVFDIPDEPIDDNLVSVMMPIEMSFDSVLAAIKKSCANVGVKCLRADDIWESSTIIQDVFKLIYCSSIVVVDFSGRNPNVFYEAGIAHTLGKDVIPITQSLDDVPFDLRHHRVLKYLNNAQGLSDFSNHLESRLKTLIRPG